MTLTKSYSNCDKKLLITREKESIGDSKMTFIWSSSYCRNRFRGSEPASDLKP